MSFLEDQVKEYFLSARNVVFSRGDRERVSVGSSAEPEKDRTRSNRLIFRCFLFTRVSCFVVCFVALVVSETVGRADARVNLGRSQLSIPELKVLVNCSFLCQAGSGPGGRIPG